MLDKILHFIKKLIPKKIFSFFQPAYHHTLVFLSALFYRFPSNNIKVIAVTGTKGKTTVVELINTILEEAGYKTALSSTLRFKIDNVSIRNTYKMTMPGRFFIQKFLRKAVRAGCSYAIIEITSEGVKQFRHKFISLDALVFTNISPEHIESHGSFEKYVAAKFAIGKELETSRKKHTSIIANKDDKYGKKFLDLKTEKRFPYWLAKAHPYTIKKEGLVFTIDGMTITSHLSGEFNLYNILAAVSCAESQGVTMEITKRAIEKFRGIPGRVEKIDAGQNFTVIVDYAHTADSLEKLYEVFGYARKICVLGSTGGGRDKWKRKEMGSVASRHCSKIILTNEDPYDEDPQEIISGVKEGITRPIVETVMDRREAIRHGLEEAMQGDVVLITGKGTDPYIMGSNNTKIPWSDADVAREELQKLIAKD